MNIESKKSIRLFWAIGLVILAIILVLDWTVHHHAHFAKDGITIDTLPDFFPLFGFASCFVLVVFSKTLAINLKRKDSYYDDE